MPKYIDTSGNTKIAIGVCGRCNLKFPYVDLVPDPNAPGLYVCQDDRDQFDPYRLPARETENITLDHPRPDVGVNTQGPSPALLVPPVDGQTQVGFVHAWLPSTPYAESASVTPQNINNPAVDLPQNWFLCVQAGTSGSSAPVWPQEPGVRVTDGTVIWLNLGIYPN